MTFKEFVAECEMYKYSKENYDLLKECTEIKLIEKFIENQQFMEYQLPVITADNIAITEGFFAESANEDTLTTITEAVNQKKNKVIEKILNGLKRVLEAFINFCKKIYNQFDAVTRNAQNVLSELRKINFTTEDVSELKDILKKNKPKGFFIKFNQPFTSSLKLKISEGVQVDELIYALLSVVLSNTTVKISTSNTRGNGVIGAVDIGTLSKVCKGLVKSRKNYDVDSVAAMIETAYTNAVKNGINVLANSKQINNTIADMETLKEKITNMMNTVDQKDQEDSENEDLGRTNELYGKVIECIGATMKLYANYTKFRSAALKSLTEFVNSKKEANTETSQTVAPDNAADGE